MMHRLAALVSIRGALGAGIAFCASSAMAAEEQVIDFDRSRSCWTL